MKINYRTCDISWYIEWYAQKSDQTFSCMHQNSGTTYRLHSSDIGYLTLLMMSFNLHYAMFNWIFPSHVKLSDSIMIKRQSLLRWFHVFYFLFEININQVFTAFVISILNIVCSVVSIFNNMQYGTYTFTDFCVYSSSFIFVRKKTKFLMRQIDYLYLRFETLLRPHIYLGVCLVYSWYEACIQRAFTK